MYQTVKKSNGVGMNRIRSLIAVIVVFTVHFAPGTDQPKHEFRAAWIATASHIDFPRNQSSTSTQKSEIRQMLDFLGSYNFNAVVFQVRPGCDAFYDSNHEPWSHELTGNSGQAPNPYYDPLEYFIDQAHSRGIELHAWFNPYRISTASNLAGLDSSHVYHQHPDWVLNVGTRSRNGRPAYMFSNTLALENEDRDLRTGAVILDPGKAAVRDYTVNVFMDVVNRYNIDGVHMDDYFYPYPPNGITNEDAATFAAEPRGFTDIEDWRRDNVNLLVQSLYDSIQAVKPEIKFGISPFGIWKHNVPPDIVGLSSYDAIYCDPIAWLQAGSIDYLTPQLYWPFGGGQDYGLLMPWWAGEVSINDRQLYVGQAAYRIPNWSNQEMPNQIRLNRMTEGCKGSVFFRIRNGLMTDLRGFLDSLRYNLYPYPAITPIMTWKDSIPPLSPCSVTVEQDVDDYHISWCHPAAASDGDSAAKYVIYRFDSLSVNIEDPANILAIVPGTDTLYTDQATGLHYYVVTALDRLSNESAPMMATPLGGLTTTSLPEQFRLYQSYPNPFNPSTTIRYVLPRQATVKIAIYNLLGERIKILIDERQPAGVRTIEWDATNELGIPVSAGVYLYQFVAEDNRQTRKMVLLK